VVRIELTDAEAERLAEILNRRSLPLLRFAKRFRGSLIRSGSHPSSAGRTKGGLVPATYEDYGRSQR
jgi:hypothetical protein